ncbi:hypothetical protein GCM10027596_39920 [Nocardioides korecus]
MAAEILALFSATDEELFDAGRIVHTRRDIRTVGEMLHDADHLARNLLIDVTGEDAGHLLRSWPTLVDAASQLWEALPGRRRDPAQRDGCLNRLVATTSTFPDFLARPGSWPGDGPAHTGVGQISETLRTVGALIGRYGTDVPTHQSRTARDIDATRARVMHTLYVTAHAITVALNSHGRDLVRDSRSQGRAIPLSSIHTPYAVPPTVAWMQRAARCENLAHNYLEGRFATAPHGEAVRSTEDQDRIPRALARWDIQAHRTLAHDPSPANLVLITRSQSLITGASITLFDAVVHDRPHDVDEAPQLERARPAISRAAASWSQLGSRWHDLTRPSDRLDPALAAAAAEVRAAYRELTRDVTAQASPEAIAKRPGLGRGFAASLDSLEAASELAHGVAEQADRSDLAGPARALSHRAHKGVEAGQATAGLDHDQAWVSPADIFAKRLVSLPSPVAEGLLRVSAEVAQAAASASAVARTKSQSQASNIAEPSSRAQRRLSEAVGLARPEAILERSY